jgi:3-oxoisoapionate kinase
VTAGQIDWAAAHGFESVPVTPAAPEPRRAINAAVAALGAGRSVVIHTHRGQPVANAWPATQVGALLGRIAWEVLARVPVSRFVIAGGDTSGHAARALGIEALEMIAPLAPGAPLCRVHATGSPAHGREVNFKGGQVGAEDYFGAVAAGQRTALSSQKNNYTARSAAELS